jgi:DNA-binding response OmpR family regulator
MKILLVEDSRFLRVAIERALAKAGHEVIGIPDGRHALLAARSNLPAIILLDMMLPGLDGTGVLKELKQNSSTSHIPVIVLTGLSQKNEAKLKEVGAAAYIEKSSLNLAQNADALIKVMVSVLDRSREVLGALQHKRRSSADAETNGAEAQVDCPLGTP